MGKADEGRQKVLQTATRLFRVQGYTATGLQQILDESGAPKGSMYFYFPGGKSEIAIAALEQYRQQGLDAIGYAKKMAGNASFEVFAKILCKLFAEEMAASGFRLGCAAQNIAAEQAPQDPALTAAVAEVFSSWAAAIAAVKGSGGQAGALALLSALEGARTLSRVRHDTAAFDAIVLQRANSRRTRRV